ncbi:chaperonin 10-like protein [Dactylonectria macrodidyma]|uniref:Chaperonin 10-like protein n=1 Tax=Dactylonectria macrodidyma TaxID=307937 RepID=A0A9P9J1Q0_9HYPO|nr:chaperonin 10-like protein [Dactylonectria macrodidyma]
MSSATRRTTPLLRNKTSFAIANGSYMAQRRRLHSMKAVVIEGSAARLDYARRVPALRDDCILVRPVAVALNPTDWRHIDYRRAKDNCILGCDYAGVVEAVGRTVNKTWKRGDRIFGCAHGANLVNPDDGVFGEFATVIGDLQMRVPESLSFEQSATLGLGSLTVGQGLFQKSLRLDLPVVAANEVEKKNIPVLIYGGTSSTGALGIQYAKQSGYTVVTACSPEDFGYVKSLGADFAVDYKDVEAGEKIRQYTNNELRYAWDTISIDSSAQICATALTTDSSLKPIYGNLLPVQSPRKDVSTITTVMHTAFGREFMFGKVHMPASREDFEFAKTFSRITEKLLAQGRLRPHNHHVGEGGLKGVLQGLQDLKEGKVNAAKLVYRVVDTPRQ